MQGKYSDIVKHIPGLEDHGSLYMYSGTPYSEECYVFGEDLILSYECNDLCWSIADEFEDKFMDALNNGYLIRLLKRLEHWN